MGSRYIKRKPFSGEVVSEDLGYLRDNIPQDEENRKCLKCLIDTYLLVDARTKEERNIILVSPEGFF